MEARRDIKIEKSFINANNDFEWFDSDQTHIKNIIQSTAGAYKESPTMGVSINNYLNSSSSQNEVSRKVIIELNADLYQCNNPIVTYSQDGTLTIDPNVII